VSASAGRKWRAHPAAENDIERLAEDDPKLKLRAIALLDLLADGRIEGLELKDKSFYGDLSDCFKFYFGVTGDAITHRIVYRKLADGGIEIVEAIAVEAREDGYVYLLASARMGRLPATAKKAYNRIHQKVVARRGERAESRGVDWRSVRHAARRKRQPGVAPSRPTVPLCPTHHVGLVVADDQHTGEQHPDQYRHLPHRHPPANTHGRDHRPRRPPAPPLLAFHEHQPATTPTCSASASPTTSQHWAEARLRLRRHGRHLRARRHRHPGERARNATLALCQACRPCGVIAAPCYRRPRRGSSGRR